MKSALRQRCKILLIKELKKTLITLKPALDENIPRFVSHYLYDLLVVGFGSLDASAHLSRVEQLCSEVWTMRVMLQEQVKACENQQTTTAALDHWITLIELSKYTSGVQTGKSALQEEKNSKSGFIVPDELSSHVEGNGAVGDQPSMTEWSTVVKRGHHTKRVPQPKDDKDGAATQALMQREWKKTTVLV